MSSSEGHRSIETSLFQAAFERIDAGRTFMTDIVPPAPGASHSTASDAPSETKAVEQLARDTANRVAWESFYRRKRRRFRLCIILFLLTFASTTLVGAKYWPLHILYGFLDADQGQLLLTWLNENWPTQPDVTYTLTDRLLQSLRVGCMYSIPLMIILLCHELGHYLQAVRYRVPASYPFFIPLPVPPLGTMGAVILQGRGAADRRMLFDIAVSGPLAGLVITMPVLYYGIATSGYVPTGMAGDGFELGQPLLIRWLIQFVHGPAPVGMTFYWNGFAMAGWVGVFVTAMNMLPIGQLDGGHILYTLIGRRAHWVAWGLILVAVAAMCWFGMYSYVLLLILLTITGPRHPPTANDRAPIGRVRQLIGWATLAFLPVGFTLQPIVIPGEQPSISTSDAAEIAAEHVQTDSESLEARSGTLLPIPR